MIIKFFIIIYLTTFLLCFSSYAIYPFIIYLLGRMNRFSVTKRDVTPPVSIIISAYNESNDIENKIRNTLALDYPKDSFEILIGSDGSTDDTAKLVSKYTSQGIIFYDFKHNRGKTAVQNELVAKAKHDILIFTDAASYLPQNAMRMIVRNFADKRVGCVAGNMRFIDTDKNITTQSQGVYWNYETKLRSWESAIGSLIGVDGPLYALRKQCYVPLGNNIISDLMTPLIVLGQRKKVVLEPKAFVDELPKEKSDQEFDTRRRITLRGMVGIFSYAYLLNPLKYPMLSIQIFLHKVIRWWVGSLVVLNTIACLLLALINPWFGILLIGYAIFFMAALLGWRTASSGIKVKVLSIPYYFCLVNIAATMGIIDFLNKKQATTWKTVR